MKQKGLGKGLNALLSQEALGNVEDKGIKMVNINDVEPNYEQPRKNFSQEELNELSQSIMEYGVLQPLIVRQKGTKYQIIAGERRYRAARQAQIQEIPIIVKDITDQETLEISLIENIQRENLNAMELSCAYSLLMERFDLTQERIADRLGKSRSSIANILRLLTLTPFVQQQLREDKISLGHAKLIVGLRNAALQKQVCEAIVEKGLSVRETEKYIQLLVIEKKDKKAEPVNPFYKEIQENLQKMLGTKVSITNGKKKGKIEIEYYSDEELERIINRIQ
ncbi:MAG: ParB/RepB/Spo0J family partition protein [Cellulosilyticaceae bacterium]